MELPTLICLTVESVVRSTLEVALADTVDFAVWQAVSCTHWQGEEQRDTRTVFNDIYKQSHKQTEHCSIHCQLSFIHSFIHWCHLDLLVGRLLSHDHFPPCFSVSCQSLHVYTSLNGWPLIYVINPHSSWSSSHFLPVNFAFQNH